MASAERYKRKICAISIFAAMFLLITTIPVHAYFYVGGDWGGRDLTLLSGDSLSGVFSNIGQFYIPVGTSITGAGGNLSLAAGRISIDGSLLGVQPGYDLSLSAGSDLILSGMLANWRNVTLEANTINLANTSTIATISGSIPYSPVESINLSAGGTLPAGGNNSGKPGMVSLGTIEIAGGSTQLLNNNSGLVVTTPIPAAAWLFGSGLLGLAGIRRKRKIYQGDTQWNTTP